MLLDTGEVLIAGGSTGTYPYPPANTAELFEPAQRLAASSLTIQSTPALGTVGQTLPGPVTVRLIDGLGNPVAGVPVNLSLVANPGPAVLSGNVAATDGSGLALFPTLSVNRTGTDYTLRASSPDPSVKPSALSQPFTVDIGTLTFTQSPSGADAGHTFPVSVNATRAEGGGMAGIVHARAFEVPAGFMSPTSSASLDAAGNATLNITIAATGRPTCPRTWWGLHQQRRLRLP